MLVNKLNITVMLYSTTQHLGTNVLTVYLGVCRLIVGSSIAVGKVLYTRHFHSFLSGVEPSVKSRSVGEKVGGGRA